MELVTLLGEAFAVFVAVSLVLILIGGVDFRIQNSISLGGKNFPENRTVSGDAGTSLEYDLAAAKIGALTTRTDNDTGELTMNTGHGITTGQRLDVHWVESGVYKCRYGMTVGTVATNAVPIDGGAGDNLPADETAVRAQVPTSLAFNVVGNNMEAIALTCVSNGPIQFVLDNAGTVHLAKLVLAGTVYHWDSGEGTTNPLAGDTVLTLYISQYSTSASKAIAGLVY